MSDDRFGDIADADEESTEGADPDEGTDAPDEETEDVETGTPAIDGGAAEAATAEGDSGDDDMPGPPYPQPEQWTVHAREEYWHGFQDAMEYEVKRLLSQEFGIRDVNQYEVTTAMLRLVATEPEALAYLVLDERGVEIDEEEWEEIVS